MTEDRDVVSDMRARLLILAASVGAIAGFTRIIVLVMSGG